VDSDRFGVCGFRFAVRRAADGSPRVGVRGWESAGGGLSSPSPVLRGFERLAVDGRLSVQRGRD